jgi:hypothetical protein
MLKLRRATVLDAGAPKVASAAEQELLIELAPAGDSGTPSRTATAGAERDGRVRAAIADLGLVGRAEVGDEVIVNVQALDLGLGSGGFDIVHVNLTRGLRGGGATGANVMKLNYTSLQHAIVPVEDERLSLPLEQPVAVLALHGQLAAVAWAFARGRPGAGWGTCRRRAARFPAGARTRFARCASTDCWPVT